MKGGGGSPYLPLDQGTNINDPIVLLDGSGVTDFHVNLDPTLFPTLTVYDLFVEVVPASNTAVDFTLFSQENFVCVAEAPATGCTDNFAPQGTANLQPVSPTNLPYYGFEIDFSGVFTQGQDISVDVPEPSSLALLLAGMLALVLAVGSKYRNTGSVKVTI